MDKPEDAVKQYFNAFLTSDPAAVTGCFEGDAVIVSPAEGPVRGDGEISRFFQRTFAQGKVLEVQVYIDRALGETDIASVQAHSSLTRRLSDSGSTVKVLARELFVLRRREGNWLISDYMFNVTP